MAAAFGPADWDADYSPWYVKTDSGGNLQEMPHSTLIFTALYASVFRTDPSVIEDGVYNGVFVGRTGSAVLLS